MLLLGNKFPNNWRRSNHIPVVACHFFPRSLSIQWVQCLVLNHHYQLLVDTHILRPISYNIVNFNSSLLITNPGDLLINITPSTSFPHNKKNTKQKHPQLHLPQKNNIYFRNFHHPPAFLTKKIQHGGRIPSHVMVSVALLNQRLKPNGKAFSRRLAHRSQEGRWYVVNGDPKDQVVRPLPFMAF